MNSFPDVCYKLAEISKSLEPEHYFYFITVFGLSLIFGLLIQFIIFITQLFLELFYERRLLKQLFSQNDIK